MFDRANHVERANISSLIPSVRLFRSAGLSDRFAVTNDCRRVLGVRSLLDHTDCDAGAAGAARTVKGDPQRGAAGHSARLGCPDVAAAYQSVLRTRAR